MMQLFINSNISTETPLVDRNVIFAELGQSNIQGRQGDTTNPDYPFTSTIGASFWEDDEFTLISTERQEAQGGCHLNYFCDKIYELKKIIPLTINPGRGGAGLTAVSSGSSSNWSATGTLRISATSLMDSIIVETGGSLPMCALWCQGERDAQEMDSNGAYTYAIVKAAMQDVIDWWQTNYPNSPFLISETGHFSGGDTQGFEDMRQIQNEMVTENTNVYMAFNGAKDFPAQGLMKDSLHYKWEGYKLMGEAFANKYAELI